jgi:hypothetical protein
MKNKIYLIFLIGSFIFSLAPMVAFADWCSNVGGEWHDNGNGMDTCYCMENGVIKSAATSDENCDEEPAESGNWCTNVGGVFCTSGGHMSCYCSDGEVLSASSCSGSGTFSCSSLGLDDPENPTPTPTPDPEDPTPTPTPGPTTGTGITNPIDAETFSDLVDLVIEWILNIAMVLAPLVIVYGGFTYITAAGDTSKMNQAKQIILYAVIGFILALLAWSLVGIFQDLVVR